MNIVLVLLGGAVGASARFLLDRAVQRHQTTRFPWGTFAVNALGCLVIGFLTGAVTAGAAGASAALFLGTGVCGALTTFSTFAWGTTHLASTGETVRAVGNACATALTALGAVFVGITVAQSLWSPGS
ncbi:fluoride efflux transporter CrcB [Streptomyces sp. NPDC004376]